MTDSDYRIESSRLADLIRFGRAEEELSAATGRPMVVASLDDAQDFAGPQLLKRQLTTIPAVLVGTLARELDERTEWLVPLFDIVLAGASVQHHPAGAVSVPDIENAIEGLARNVRRNPLAAVSLTILLRGKNTQSIDAELAAESAVYSLLQAGPEFALWRSTRESRTRPQTDGPAVIVRRDENTLRVTLNSQHVHNAFSTRMRDALCDALALAHADASITSVIVDGAGPSFCSGGYLDEFGTLPDPATAHIIRLTRSARRLMARLSQRAEVRLHGAAMGAGIELAAFAHHVVADPATRIALPELSLGLLPGAGGTVSLPRRIGCQRTLYLALSESVIDAQTALSWGLVDEVRERERW